MSDKYFSSVSLLLGMNGVNNATTVTDESPSPKTMSFVGNSKLSTANAKFGSASLLLDGSGDYITTPNHADFALPGDCTVEAWIYPVEVGDTKAIVSKRTSGQGGGWQLSLNPLQQATWSAWQGGAGNPVCFSIGSSSSLALNSWHHVRGVVDSGTAYLYVNGVLESTGGKAGSVGTTTGVLLVGRDPISTARDWDGYVDEVRITTGVARHMNGLVPQGPFSRAKRTGVLGGFSQPNIGLFR